MAFPSMIKLSAVVAFFAAGAFSLALSSENTVDVLEKRQAATSIPVLYCTDANFGGECKVDRIPVGTCCKSPQALAPLQTAAARER